MTPATILEILDVPVVPGDEQHFCCDVYPLRTLCGFRFEEDDIEDMVYDDEPSGCIVCDELVFLSVCCVCGTECGR